MMLKVFVTINIYFIFMFSLFIEPNNKLCYRDYNNNLSTQNLNKHLFRLVNAVLKNDRGYIPVEVDKNFNIRAISLLVSNKTEFIQVRRLLGKLEAIDIISHRYVIRTKYRVTRSVPPERVMVHRLLFITPMPDTGKGNIVNILMIVFTLSSIYLHEITYIHSRAAKLHQNFNWTAAFIGDGRHFRIQLCSEKTCKNKNIRIE